MTRVAMEITKGLSVARSLLAVPVRLMDRRINLMQCHQKRIFLLNAHNILRQPPFASTFWEAEEFHHDGPDTSRSKLAS
jgi:hypothetical protein